VDFITLTYLDNEGLTAGTLQEILAHQNNVSWWKVYGLGQLGEVEGKIYRDWKIIDEVPHEARLERYGVDFGYSNDPTAIVAIYYYNGGYILDEIAYAKGMSNKLIADTILAQEQKALVIADSAEPKSIAEMIELKVNVIGVQKHKGETKDQNFKKWSIGIVQQQRVSVTKRSVNVIKEYRNYLWETDKDGKILNVPEHAFSHSMDAISYGFVSIIEMGSRHVRQYVQPPTEPSEFEGGNYNPSVAREHGPMQNVFNRYVDDQPQYERQEFE
jgi:phage terminase large subunit